MIVSIKKRIIFLFFRLIHLKTGLFIRMNFLIIQNKCNFILFYLYSLFIHLEKWKQVSKNHLFISFNIVLLLINKI